MEKRICIKCQEPKEGGLPLCDKCRAELKDFGILASYLNNFKGELDDLFWILNAGIADRECSIVSHVKVVNDVANGCISLVPIEPSNSTLEQKPWLRDKYLSIKQTIQEIQNLRRALGKIKQQYGADSRRS